MFQKNFPYIQPEIQAKLDRTHVLLAGVGLGSVIAEALLRIGVGRLTVVDADVVERTNLNRQNFTARDVGRPKALALADRLLSIRPDAKITALNQYLTPENIGPLALAADLVVNTVDFESDMLAACNRACREAHRTVLFPVNFGWASLLFVHYPDSPPLETWLNKRPGRPPQETITLRLVESLLARGRLPGWFPEVWRAYRALPQDHGDPQMYPAACSVAASCAAVTYSLAAGDSPPGFPVPLFHDHATFKQQWPTPVGLLKTLLFRLAIRTQRPES